MSLILSFASFLVFSGFAFLFPNTQHVHANSQKETFLLFAQPIPSSDLGFVDRKASSLNVEIAGREFDVSQAPGVLESRRSGGTTGAVLWNVTPRLAHWLSSPTNPLFPSVLGPSSYVLELGCGPSGLLALVTAGRVERYTLTDQPYVLKTLSANLLANEDRAAPQTGKGKKKGRQAKEKRQGMFGAQGNIAFVELDWEKDVPGPSLAGDAGSLDAVLAADCIYNEALVRPFVQTCADTCALRGTPDEGAGEPTVCVVAQQLREPGVFGAWMEAFHARFRTWRVPDGVVGAGLGEGSGFVVHVGVLR